MNDAKKPLSQGAFKRGSVGSIQGTAGTRASQHSAIAEALSAGALFEASIFSNASHERDATVKRPCNCGRTCAADARFCDGCGAALPVPSTPPAPVPAPAFRVVCVSPENKSVSASLSAEADELTIGCGAVCGIVIGQDDYVSREHVRVQSIEGQLFIEDRGSTNGTYLRVRGSMLVDDGDEFIVGSTVFRIERFTRPA